MSPFEIYLRTGLIVSAPEAKFNPWHDVENGQFTFRNTGRHWGANDSPDPNNGNMARRPRRGSGSSTRGAREYGGGGASGSWSSDAYGGFGGGGGDFGGGGASGSWDAPKPKPKPPKTQRREARVNASSTRDRAAVAHPAFTEVRKNGYTYKLDHLRRPRDIRGDLQSGPAAQRSRRAQLQAGGPNRRPSDDGGHYIARRFNGPRDAFNHFAQDRNFNRGAYREMESAWGREIAAGRKVSVRIVPKYRRDSQRPSSITVFWTVAGRQDSQIFANEPGGGRNGR